MLKSQSFITLFNMERLAQKDEINKYVL